jgi:catechol 2,3-dioxygenase-like lactoylglutathione lyase family enzyme
MAVTSMTPMLTVPNIDKSVGFYTDTLGFSVVNQMEGWAVVQKDGFEVMFALPNEHVPFEKPHFTGSIYFNVDDVETVWAKLKERVKVVYDLETFPYGMKEFAILDGDGYLLQFGQPIAGNS